MDEYNYKISVILKKPEHGYPFGISRPIDVSAPTYALALDKVRSALECNGWELHRPLSVVRTNREGEEV